MTENINTYQAALTSMTYFVQPNAGYLRVAERDRIDFLQRQTTNDLRLVSEDRSIWSVLTSPTARIQDVFCVIDEGESLGVITLSGRNVETTKFLQSRIFFSDKVSVRDLSTEFAQVLLFGPQVDTLLEKLDLKQPMLDQACQGTIANQPITVISQKIISSIGYRILIPATSIDAVLTELDRAGVTAVDSGTFEILRVEAGQPGPGGELVEAYTPLEVHLGELISDSKGCYTGQEIIARQITYDKVTKILVGVKQDELVQAGSEITVDGKSAGLMTSVAHSPRFGSIGLAVVRRQYSQVGQNLSVVGMDGIETEGRVVDLPFL